jgi:starch-binding outer membrane protein, SusD/RagB family
MATERITRESGTAGMLPPRYAGRLAWWVALVVVALTGCDTLDDLISVEAPSRVAAQDLDDPANADLLVNSAVNDFRCALVHFIAAGAYVGNEWGVGGDTGGGSYVWYDARVFTPGGWTSMYATGDCSGTAPNVYQPLSTARWMADDAIRRLDEWGDAQVPNRVALTAKAAAFAGYSLTLLGEAMCSAALDRGPEMTPDEIFAEAEDRFTRAIEAASQVGEQEILNLARVGRARVRLNRGQSGGAASDAAAVPEGFAFQFNYSSADASTENKLFALMERELMATVEPMYRNMAFQGHPDPRVQVVDLGLTGPGTDIEIWATPKYPGLDAPVPVATWEEAQLIMAEAALEAGQLQDAVGIINTLHSRVGLPGFSSNNAAEIRNQLIYERSAELFLEGQHMQDLERFNLPLLPVPGSPFYHGGVYSDQICFPLPEVEYLNNPNINR